MSISSNLPPATMPILSNNTANTSGAAASGVAGKTDAGDTANNKTTDDKATNAGAAKPPAKAAPMGGATSIEDSLAETIAANKRRVIPQVGVQGADTVVSTVDGSIDYKKLAQMVDELQQRIRPGSGKDLTSLAKQYADTKIVDFDA